MKIEEIIQGVMTSRKTFSNFATPEAQQTVPFPTNCDALYNTKQTFLRPSDAQIQSVKASCIPNVVTPNEDRFQDSFVINDWLPGAGLYIYKRWGKQVYTPNKHQNEWQADHLPHGVYRYNLRHPRLPTALKGWISVLN